MNQIFNIQSIITGGSHESFLVRYRGMLKIDSEQAHNWLADVLQPQSLVPLFNWEDDHHLITIVPELPRKKQKSVWLNVILFVITFLSVLFAGALYTATSDPFLMMTTFEGFLAFLWDGLPFASSFLTILAAHEFGHYFAGKRHNVNVSLPFFIPFPLNMVGTMGAFINMKTAPRNRKHLLDIAIAGPLSGLIITIPILFLGLHLSTIDTIPLAIPANSSFQLEGNSIFYLFAKFIVFKQWLPYPLSYGDVHPFLYWIRFFFTGQPLPLGGLDVIIHPVAWAGWAGLLITMLNLIPAGQFDGGHVFHVLFGSKGSNYARPIIIALLFLLGFAWSGWWIWAGLVLFLGRVHAEPLDQITELDKNRKILGYLVLLIFILIFIPVPLIIVTG